MTTPLGHTSVNLLVLHRALEKSLAALACEQAVVVATDFIAAHGTQLLDQILQLGLIARVDAVANGGQQGNVVLLVIIGGAVIWMVA